MSINPMPVSIDRGQKATDDSQGDNWRKEDFCPGDGDSSRGLYVAGTDREALSSRCVRVSESNYALVQLDT